MYVRQFLILLVPTRMDGEERRKGTSVEIPLSNFLRMILRRDLTGGGGRGRGRGRGRGGWGSVRDTLKPRIGP